MLSNAKLNVWIHRRTFMKKLLFAISLLSAMSSHALKCDFDPSHLFGCGGSSKNALEQSAGEK